MSDENKERLTQKVRQEVAEAQIVNQFVVDIVKHFKDHAYTDVRSFSKTLNFPNGGTYLLSLQYVAGESVNPQTIFKKEEPVPAPKAVEISAEASKTT